MLWQQRRQTHNGTMSVPRPGSMRGSQVERPLLLLLFLLLLHAGTGKQTNPFPKTHFSDFFFLFTSQLSSNPTQLMNFNLWRRSSGPWSSSLNCLFETLHCSGFWLLVFYSPTVVFCLNELLQFAELFRHTLKCTAGTNSSLHHILVSD